MTTELFIPIKFRTTIILTPSEITKDFESTILTKLKINYENICSKYGYIKKDTIKIIKRSVGQLKKEHFFFAQCNRCILTSNNIDQFVQLWHAA